MFNPALFMRFGGSIPHFLCVREKNLFYFGHLIPHFLCVREKNLFYFGGSIPHFLCVLGVQSRTFYAFSPPQNPHPQNPRNNNQLQVCGRSGRS